MYHDINTLGERFHPYAEESAEARRGFKFCLVSGTAALLNVKVGDVVKSGQTVATVHNDSAMTLKVLFASDDVDGFASSLWRKSEFSERGTEICKGPHANCVRSLLLAPLCGGRALAARRRRETPNVGCQFALRGVYCHHKTQKARLL